MSYIRGPYAIAATSLIDELRAKGISANVGYFSRKRDRTLIVQTAAKFHDRVPAEFMGFKVRSETPKDGRS